MLSRCRRQVAIFALVLLAWEAGSSVLAAEPTPARRRTMDPQRFSASYGYPGTGVDPVPLPGRKPYWGQALGATYYNWGYFGAHQHAQYINHSGYYNEYIQYGYSKGY
jgi:hypothetical protein